VQSAPASKRMARSRPNQLARLRSSSEVDIDKATHVKMRAQGRDNFCQEARVACGVDNFKLCRILRISESVMQPRHRFGRGMCPHLPNAVRSHP
jgi:hypothetical protein